MRFDLAPRWMQRLCAHLCIGLAAGSAGVAHACIFASPLLPRMHFLITLKDAAAKPVALQSLDLLSVVLPSGEVDDWKVEILQGLPATLRTLTAQEWDRVISSPRFHTTTLTSTSASRPGNDGALLRFGALQPGQAGVHLENLTSHAKYSMVLHVGSRTPPRGEAERLDPPRPGEPVPAC